MENKSKPVTILTWAFIALSAGLLVFILVSRDSSNFLENEASNNSLKTESKTAGAVEVSATPLLTKSSYEFDISLNTHATELNYDLTSLSTLTDDKNQSLRSIKWEGDDLGGHHRKGKLIFSGFGQKPKTLSLTINNIDGQDINFKWEIN